MVLQSSLTIVAPKGQPKPLKEGADALLVTWNGPDDPEVSQDHISLAGVELLIIFLRTQRTGRMGKKIWVMMSQVSLLTFSVHIGSAIYPPIPQGLKTSYLVAATLGFTLFVAGGLGILCIDVLNRYLLNFFWSGPMLWSPLS